MQRKFLHSKINSKIYKLLFILLSTVVIVICFPANSKTVFVLIANSGSENEGIYTISYNDEESDNSNEVIIFESQEDASHYNELLKKQNIRGLVVEEIKYEEVEEFCKYERYKCRVISEGTPLVPPARNKRNNFLPQQNPNHL